MDNVNSYTPSGRTEERNAGLVWGTRRKKRPVGSSVAFSSIHDITDLGCNTMQKGANFIERLLMLVLYRANAVMHPFCDFLHP